MELRIDIETPFGTKVGSGPIISAANWSNRTLLDKAGSFSFDMALADAQYNQVADGRFAHCYGVIGGLWQEVGKPGIIKRQECIINPSQPTTIRVSGPDLLYELTYRMVGPLQIMATEQVDYTECKFYDSGGPSYTDKVEPFTFSLIQTCYLYVGYTTLFTGLVWDLGATKNTTACTTACEFYNGTNWSAIGGFSDGTMTGGNTTLGQDGTMSWTRPGNWETTTIDSDIAYWVRLYPVGANTDSNLNCTDLDVLGDGPTTNGPALIMAYAPAGWSLDTTNGYSLSQNDAYLFFDGESVLEALTILAENTGEHFILGSGRKVIWLQDDPVASPIDCGYQALPAYGPDSHENKDACWIESMTESNDGYEQISRVYPWGAGSGTDRISLANTTDTPPAGYTRSSVSISGKTIYYIKHDATDTVAQIERQESWPEVAKIENDTVHNKHVANQLQRVAIDYLSRRLTTQTAYNVRVRGLSGIVSPGNTMAVNYWEYLEGKRVLDIDQNLVILEADIEVSANGVFTVALVLSTTDMWPASEVGLIAEHIRKSIRSWGSGAIWA